LFSILIVSSGCAEGPGGQLIWAEQASDAPPGAGEGQVPTVDAGGSATVEDRGGFSGAMGGAMADAGDACDGCDSGACGALQAACCDGVDPCDEGLSCTGGVCLEVAAPCGELGQSCCEGSSCTASLVCADDTCSPAGPFANMVSVEAHGVSEVYTFQVEVQSNVQLCDHRADFWEVLTPDGVLLFRHLIPVVSRRDGTRTHFGAPVRVAADQPLIIRAHMDPTGYGQDALVGSVQGGFERTQLEWGFAAELEGSFPQPRLCQ